MLGMVKMEMPFLMNVILYVENSVIFKLPFINKKCNDACNAMKINPWKNWNNKIKEFKAIQNTFPSLDTLRLDLSTFQELEGTSIIKTYDNYEFVKETITPQEKEIPKYVLKKCHTSFISFNCDSTTKVVWLYFCDSQILNNLKKYRNIRYLYVSVSYVLTINLINILNELSGVMKVTIFLDEIKLKYFPDTRYKISDQINFAFIKFQSLYVVPKNMDMNCCISPLGNYQNVLLFEKLYLPTQIILNISTNFFVDLTPFHYIKNIIITPVDYTTKRYIKLPTSTENIIFKNNDNHDDAEIDHTEIVNWNDLTKLQTIDENYDIYIPYPQLKLKKHQPKLPTNSVHDICLAILNGLCMLYLFSSFIFSIIRILLSWFNPTIIQFSSFLHIFCYSHLAFITFNSMNYFHGSSFKSFIYILIITSCFMWYPYSLFFYESRIWVNFMALLTLPLIILHYCEMVYYSRINTNDINLFINLILHGNWISVITEQKITNYFSNDDIYLIPLLGELYISLAFIFVNVTFLVTTFSLHGTLGLISLCALGGIYCFTLLLCCY